MIFGAFFILPGENKSCQEAPQCTLYHAGRVLSRLYEELFHCISSVYG